MLQLLYILQVARQKDKFALCQILPYLSECHDRCSYDDTFLHALVSFLICMVEDFTNEEFCEVVFQGFFKVSFDNLF